MGMAGGGCGGCGRMGENGMERLSYRHTAISEWREEIKSSYT